MRPSATLPALVLALALGAPTSARAATEATCEAPRCDDVDPGSLPALRCRLGILAEQIDAAPGLAAHRPRLQRLAGLARDRAEDAAAACAVQSGGTATRRVRQAGGALRRMARALAELSAGRRIDPGVRAGLGQAIESIRADVGALRRRPCHTP